MIKNTILMCSVILNLALLGFTLSNVSDSTKRAQDDVDHKIDFTLVAVGDLFT